MSDNSPNTHPANSHQQGFSLLEVMVAVFLLAILFTFAIISLPDTDSDDLSSESRKLRALLLLAQQEAINRQIELGLRVEAHGYQFMLFDNGRWLPLQDSELGHFRTHELDERFAFHISQDGLPFELADAAQDSDDPEQEEIKPPQIIVLSSGEQTEFVLTVGTYEKPWQFFRLTGYYDGEVNLEGAIEGHYVREYDKQVPL